jgi:hypothetical protein
MMTVNNSNCDENLMILICDFIRHGTVKNRIFSAATTAVSFLIPLSAFAFEGHITASQNRNGDIQTIFYTVGTNALRIERGETNRPYARNLIALDTGAVTLLFPHNRSFVRLAASAGNNSPAKMPGIPARPNMPGLPPGIGPQASGSTPGATGFAAGAPQPPSMPMMPMPGEALELKATGGKTNLLGFACEKFEIKQRGEVMEIWATDKLLPFQPYLQNQPHRFGPQMIEEQWAELVKARKLFPLLATLKFDDGAERFRFAVQSITPQKLTDEDTKLFQPPPGYFEIQPLPF